MNIVEVWRYPVKSMQGERLKQATVGPGGIRGDRRWAVVDAESGVSLSAKRYPALLRCSARTSNGEVLITVPGHPECAAGSAAVAGSLSNLLRRNVTTRSAEASEKIRHEFPTEVTEGKGQPFLHSPDTDAFFDSSTLHLITTGTLRELQRRLPESKIHPIRFRPNFLVDTEQTGFLENGWVGSDVMLGALKCRVVDDTRRCIMVALGQDELPRDTRISKGILELNDGRAGVALTTADPGLVRPGAQVDTGVDISDGKRPD